MALYDDLGREIPDPRPVEVPTGLRAGPTLQDRIRQAIRQELSDRAFHVGQETFEQADDFEVDDEEPELVTPYETHELIPEAFGKDASDLSRPEPPLPAPLPTDQRSGAPGDPAAAPGSGPAAPPPKTVPVGSGKDVAAAGTVPT